MLQLLQALLSGSACALFGGHDVLQHAHALLRLQQQHLSRLCLPNTHTSATGVLDGTSFYKDALSTPMRCSASSSSTSAASVATH
eukprot:517877-Pelagomonas_calceolata.AAC.1